MPNDDNVQVRRFPYPYRAMLAVCSDLDETPDRHAYETILRFLNTSEPTAMGAGVDLEAAGGIYFDMPADRFAYWTTDDAGRDRVRTLIRSGHIDCLHSYGDMATGRAHVARALDDLDRHDCKLEVWVDHGVAATNFGSDIMCGHGDQVGHPAYHADLTIDHGVKYVWRGRVTSMIGQDAPGRLGGLWNRGHPAASARTVAKEAVKRIVGRRVESQYAMHAANRLLRPAKLRDGRPVMEFLRANPHWGGVSSCETARGIGEVITDAMLQRLIERQGACALYTHLGKAADPAVPFDERAVRAFGRLAAAHRDGRILVAATGRMLRYLDMRDRVGFRTREVDGRLDVSVRIGPDERGDVLDPAGLTLYVPRSEAVRLTINGAAVETMWTNPPDHTGRPSVSAPWPRLEFPTL